jgi:hypothetical protein
MTLKQVEHHAEPNLPSPSYLGAPPVSPVNKKARRVEAKSAIRTAIEEGSKKGLMSFFKQSTREEYEAQVRRDTAEAREFVRDREVSLSDKRQHKMNKAREAVRLRKQRQRQRLYDAEIARGERTPQGTKRTRKVSTISRNSKIIGSQSCRS